MNRRIVTLLFITLCGSAFSQSAFYKTAVSTADAYHFKEALPRFQLLLKEDSLADQRLEYASICYSRVGHTLIDEKARPAYYKIADYLASKAIKLRPNSAEAHYAKALALGRLNENASSKEKIANSKKIKTEIDAAIKYDPKHGGAYHILGRWHHTIANFSAIEKLAINTMFGGVPEGGSLEDSEKAFLHAIRYEPNYKLHYYELAQTYKDMGNDKNYKLYLKKGLDLPDQTEEDPETDKKIKVELGIR
jgi:regulator of microtubule dynamics protein 3